MKAEKEFDLIAFIRSLEKKRIPYLLIGRWAVILHGAPLMTADYDFWVSSRFQKQVLQFLKREDYEVPDVSWWDRPILSVYCGPDKIDFVFFEKMKNREGQTLVFQDCFKRADLKEDRRRRIIVRIPSIDDLIALKKVTRASQEKEAQDATDVRYLESIKRGRHES